MPTNFRLALDPNQMVEAAFSFPPFSLAVALFVAGAIVTVASRAARAAARLSDTEPPSVRARYAPEHRALGVIAAAVIALFIAEFVIRGYILTGPDLIWWSQFAFPVFCALIGIGVILSMIVTRGTTPPEAPVPPAGRRNWTSFSSHMALVGGSAVLLALVATSVAAGLASSPNGEGQYIWLTIPIPNEPGIDPIRLKFYGWTYGVPVLGCLVALTAATWTTLGHNAARPYLRPETVITERTARRETAHGTTRIATAAMLLTLAGAWRLTADAGSVSYLTILGQNGDAPYDAAWRYAELAVAAGWCAPLLDITAFTLLLLVTASGLRRKPVAPESSTCSAAHTSTEVVL